MVDSTTGPTTATTDVSDAGSASPLAITGGIDFQSKYIFRGFATTNQGLIAQPYAQISYTVLDLSSFLGNELTVTPYAGTWNNITSHPYQIKPGQQSGDLHWWSEIDTDLGVTMSYDNFSLGLAYVYYSYPNGSLNSDMEAGFNLAYDDSGYWASNTVFAAINPHIAYYHEFQNLGGHAGGYFEIGVAPALKPFNIGSLPVTLSAPIIMGLATDNYYTNADGSTNPFGYFEMGANASVPLNVLSNHIGGAWNLVGEVDYYLLNADNTRSSDGGKSTDVTARIGLAFKY